MAIIKNRYGEIAIIIIINSKIEIQFKEIEESLIEKPYRLYYWIDDQEITDIEIDKFKCLFNVYRLEIPKFFGGKTFSIDKLSCNQEGFYEYDENAIIIRTPRRAGDGGVIR
jgi:hypothetical protein